MDRPLEDYDTALYQVCLSRADHEHQTSRWYVVDARTYAEVKRIVEMLK